MKILVISDAGMNVDKGGLSQTMYNIFSFCEPQDFLFITSLQSFKSDPTSQPFTLRTVTYNTGFLPIQRNRAGSYVNKIISWLNYSISSCLKNFKKLKAAIKEFDTDVIIVVPNGSEGVFIYHQLKPLFKNKKVIPYFMDDWLFQTQLKWFGGNIHSLTKELLSENKLWMMISKNLAKILSDRYKITPLKVLEIHNPVDITTLKKPAPTQQKKEYTIAYAGALWQMHFDAFLVIAKAVELLNPQIKIKLKVYTSESNWHWRKAQLEHLHIIYGGFIPYKNIHSKLTEADCLLITSSFSEEWQTHSKASVQTKLTDYLKAGRLIISCGPDYSAIHLLLKQHDCGVLIETNNENEAAIELLDILKNIETNQVYVQRGYEVLEKEFSFEVVHEHLKQFLAA